MSTPESKCGFEPLEWQHIVEFASFGLTVSPARLRLTPMVGRTYRNPDGQIAMLGGVFAQGRLAEAKFVFSPLVELQDATGAPLTPLARSRAVHCTALEVLELAHRVWPVIHGRLDNTIPAARRWLERLGFSPPEDGATGADKDLWTHGLSGRGVFVDRVAHRRQCGVASVVGGGGPVGIRSVRTGAGAAEASESSSDAA